MPIAGRLLATSATSGEDGTTVLASAYAVPAGATLVVLGSGADSGGDALRLTSVADTLSNSWGTPTNVRAASSWLPNIYGCVAENVANGTPTVTLNWDDAASNAVTFALVEVTSCVTSSGVDKTVTGTSTSTTTVSTSATGTLTQADNVALLVAGGWFGVPSNPSGWTNLLTSPNGSPSVGCQVSYKVLATTDSVTGTVTYTGSASAAALMYVIKALTGSALRYKFTVQDALTSANTDVNIDVWRNGGPGTVLAEQYTGLTGSATNGVIYVTEADGLPVDVQMGNTIIACIYDETAGKGSRPYAAGVVEEVP